MPEIELLLVVAGPTACGKSTLIQHITAARGQLHTRLGLENLHDWPQLAANVFISSPTVAFNRLILHYDFLWFPNEELTAGFSIEERATSIMNRAGEVLLITLWTPPARLQHQLIQGKLRTPLPSNYAQRVKAVMFRLLPRFILVNLSTLRLSDLLNRWLPRSAFGHHLSLLRVYSRAEEVTTIYRYWFQFCDRQNAKIRDHVIVEFESELKFYSREEWENLVRIYDGGKSR